MAATAMAQNDLKAEAGIKAAGRSLEKPVYVYSLSWHPDEQPSKADMVEGEQFCRSKLEAAVLSFAAPCPVSTAEMVGALLRAGRLKINEGVHHAHLDTHGADALAHDSRVETANVLVNTTGSVNRNATDASQSPLIRNLVESGLLRGYERGGVKMLGADVDMTSFRARQLPTNWDLRFWRATSVQHSLRRRLKQSQQVSLVSFPRI